MSAPVILSLFPGIGLLDMAFEEAGMCIVRGPDLLWGGDIKRFHPPPGRFDGIIGGPPCQAWSSLRHIVAANGHQISPNLIPEFERCVAAARPDWFLMENVVEAPEPDVAGYAIRSQAIRDVWVGGVTSRLRRFSFGVSAGRASMLARWQIETLALQSTQPEHSAMASGGGRQSPVDLIAPKGKRTRRSALKNYGYKNEKQWPDHRRKQGLPPDFLNGSPLTMEGKIKCVGNGVPLPMGRAVARSILAALNGGQSDDRS